MTQFAGLDWILLLVAAPFVGSFLGLLAHRLPAGGVVVLGRSACRHCDHRLGLRDLVPLLSWILSAGRCRYCRARLGLFYPLIELAAIVIVVWSAMILSGWLLWTTCALGWLLLTLAVIDQRNMVLPDQLTLPMIPAGLLVAYLVEPGLLKDHAIGAAAGFAVFLIVGWVYRRLRGREGLGMGDAKLLAGAGAWVSWTGLAGVVLLGAAIGLAAVLALSVARRSLSPTDRVPFGPYICLGTWIVWLYGPVIMT